MRKHTRSSRPSPGPSAVAGPSAESPPISPVVSPASREFTDSTLQLIATKVQKKLSSLNLGASNLSNDASTPFVKCLQHVYFGIVITQDIDDECPVLIDIDQFVKNVKLDKK